MYLIIGLGNPGDKYKNTKHNVGFWTVDKIADKINATAEKKQCDAIVRQGIYGGKKVLLVKPQTYMNLSGHAVQQLLNYYKDRVEDILVIHDDLDLPPGKLRLKKGGGGAGGHNGIKSIIEQLGSNDFDRVKIGIGKRGNAADYVLTPFVGEDRDKVQEGVNLAAEAVEMWLAEGLNKAMNLYN